MCYIRRKWEKSYRNIRKNFLQHVNLIHTEMMGYVWTAEGILWINLYRRVHVIPDPKIFLDIITLPTNFGNSGIFFKLNQFQILVEWSTHLIAWRKHYLIVCYTVSLPSLSLMHAFALGSTFWDLKELVRTHNSEMTKCFAKWSSHSMTITTKPKKIPLVSNMPME